MRILKLLYQNLATQCFKQATVQERETQRMQKLTLVTQRMQKLTLVTQRMVQLDVCMLPDTRI
jgi:hypothetical protein